MTIQKNNTSAGWINYANYQNQTSECKAHLNRIVKLYAADQHSSTKNITAKLIHYPQLEIAKGNTPFLLPLASCHPKVPYSVKAEMA